MAGGSGAGVMRRVVDRNDLAAEVGSRLAAGYRLTLVAGHEDGETLRVVYAVARPGSVSRRDRVEIAVSVPRDDAWVPSLARLSYPAGRFEREVRDLYGVVPAGHPLPHRLVRHAHWPHGWHPMLAGSDPPPEFSQDSGSFPFLQVEGEGVYEIPVGPVHAGLIEPGHFRFSVVGETILRMKARLWFVHRGVEKLFEGRPADSGIELAERISGDTAVGHGLAYAMAVEEAAGIEVSSGDLLLRALLLELERLHNHVADLGALANDVGFGVLNAHAQRVRERLLRLNRQTTGHRLLRGGVSVGGARLQESPDPRVLTSVAAEARELVTIALGNSVVVDRFTGTAVLPREQALTLGALGYVARASGVEVDARRDHPFVDLGEHFTVVVESGGDVLSRFLVRAREVEVSAAVAVDLLARSSGDLGSGTAVTPGTDGGANGSPDPRSGLSLVEAWRGTACHRVELAPDGALRRVKVVDPSFFNWPALPVSLADTIVPDFPLANKSFNQSYAGNDL